MYNLRVNNDRDKENTASRTSSNRPDGPPDSDKDFNKILRNKERQNEEESRSSNKKGVEEDSALAYEEIADNQREVSKSSIFDLSRAKPKPTPPTQQKLGSLEEEVAQMASADELPNETAVKADELKSKKMNKKLSVKEDDSSKNPYFSTKDADLANVTPTGLHQQNQIEAVFSQAKMEPTHKISLTELIEAVVKAISTMDTNGQSDTIVTLKQPPLFEGANLVLTSYDSARGEFNIRFENLTQSAKNFMDMQQNQESLRQSLIEKGYTVHIVVNTTQVETPNFIAESREANKEQSSQEEENPKNKQKKQQDNEP